MNASQAQDHVNVADGAPHRPLPRSFVAALAVSAGLVCVVAWNQMYWWNNLADYRFGWTVPVLVAYLVNQRWPRIVSLVRALEARSCPRASGWRAWLLDTAFALLGLWGAGWFLVGAFYRATMGPSYSASFALAIGAGSLALTMVYYSSPSAPVGAPSSPITADARLKLCGCLLFLLGAWLLSAPLLGAVEWSLSRFLLHQLMAGVGFVFNALCLPIALRGNILVLPNGNVGVEEACSGIRSLIGCLFAGLFLSAALLERWRHKALLLALAILFALAANLLRALFLAGLAYAYGPNSIEGAVHDITGYAVLAGTAALLLLVTQRLAKRSESRR
ncbi:transmembrane exosortase EpsH [mine drainage metagenome]|uniref:Transmembrane exosortase EpsH n=1 Tax=mine drainage metagenome TaxID=410659 RepID=A0A1J5TMD2_9ZZZZ